MTIELKTKVNPPPTQNQYLHWCLPLYYTSPVKWEGSHPDSQSLTQNRRLLQRWKRSSNMQLLPPSTHKSCLLWCKRSCRILALFTSDNLQGHPLKNTWTKLERGGPSQPPKTWPSRKCWEHEESSLVFDMAKGQETKRLMCYSVIHPQLQVPTSALCN